MWQVVLISTTVNGEQCLGHSLHSGSALRTGSGFIYLTLFVGYCLTILHSLTKHPSRDMPYQFYCNSSCIRCILVNAVVFLKKEIHWPDRASEFYICLPCVVVYWPRAIGQWLLSNPSLTGILLAYIKQNGCN